MPLTISKRTTENTGKTSVAAKSANRIRVFRKWINLANGKTVYVKSGISLPNEAVRALKSAGISVGESRGEIVNETMEMNALLSKSGGKKLTVGERRRFAKHLTTK